MTRTTTVHVPRSDSGQRRQRRGVDVGPAAQGQEISRPTKEDWELVRKVVQNRRAAHHDLAGGEDAYVKNQQGHYTPETRREADLRQDYRNFTGALARVRAATERTLRDLGWNSAPEDFSAARLKKAVGEGKAGGAVIVLSIPDETGGRAIFYSESHASRSGSAYEQLCRAIQEEYGFEPHQNIFTDYARYEWNRGEWIRLKS